MDRLSTFLLFAILCSSVSLNADENFCRKCEVLREYHKKNPSQYEYYDDYLKDVEENGAEAVNPSTENLSPELQHYLNPDEKITQTPHLLTLNLALQKSLERV